MPPPPPTPLVRSKASHAMRIFLLPISTRQALIYCQKSTAQVNVAPASIPQRIQKKATETWAKWEEAEKGWQKTLVTYGNAGLKRIPYQEWGLKSFPPSNNKQDAAEVVNNEKFDVLFPGNLMHKDDVPKVMLRLAKERKTLHWNRFIGSAILLPITIPFALVPVIPNIPFFYAAYRCWSHWRALKGSDHLEHILNNRLYRPISTREIEDLFQRIAPESPDFNFVPVTQETDPSLPKEKLIMRAGDHSIIARALEAPELSGEVERAVWQVENQLKKADEEAAKATQAGAVQTQIQKDEKKS